MQTNDEPPATGPVQAIVMTPELAAELLANCPPDGRDIMLHAILNMVLDDEIVTCKDYGLHELGHIAKIVLSGDQIDKANTLCDFLLAIRDDYGCSLFERVHVDVEGFLWRARESS